MASDSIRDIERSVRALADVATPNDDQFIASRRQLLAIADRLAAMRFAANEPVGWMRRWAFNGETPRKDRNNPSGRLKLAPKFKFYAVTQDRIFDDDVPLYPAPPTKD